MRSVYLFFCLPIRLTISSLSEVRGGEGVGRKMNFPPELLGNTIEKYLEEYCDQDCRLCLKNSY